MKNGKVQFKIKKDIAILLSAILLCASLNYANASTDLSPINSTPTMLKTTEINTSSSELFTPKINLDIINQAFLSPKTEERTNTNEQQKINEPQKTNTFFSAHIALIFLVTSSIKLLQSIF